MFCRVSIFLIALSENWITAYGCTDSEKGGNVSVCGVYFQIRPKGVVILISGHYNLNICCIALSILPKAFRANEINS